MENRGKLKKLNGEHGVACVIGVNVALQFLFIKKPLFTDPVPSGAISGGLISLLNI